MIEMIILSLPLFIFTMIYFTQKHYRIMDSLISELTEKEVELDQKIIKYNAEVYRFNSKNLEKKTLEDAIVAKKLKLASRIPEYGIGNIFSEITPPLNDNLENELNYKCPHKHYYYKLPSNSLPPPSIEK